MGRINEVIKGERGTDSELAVCHSLLSKKAHRGVDARKDAVGTACECRDGAAEEEDSACFFSDISLLFPSEAYSESGASIGRVTAALNLCRIPQDPSRTAVFDGRDGFAAGMLLCTWQEYANVRSSS